MFKHHRVDPSASPFIDERANSPNTAVNFKNKSSEGDWENIVSPGQSRCSLADVSAGHFFLEVCSRKYPGNQGRMCESDGTESRSLGSMGVVSHQAYLMWPFWSYQNGLRDEREAELIVNEWG